VKTNTEGQVVALNAVLVDKNEQLDAAMSADIV
jgi:hypothetical protein